MTDTKLDEMARLWKMGVPRRVIAAKVGYSDDYVAQQMAKHRERFPYRRKNIDQVTKSRCVDLVTSGKFTATQVAEALGVTASSVRSWVRSKKGGKA